MLYKHHWESLPPWRSYITSVDFCFLFKKGSCFELQNSTLEDAFCPLCHFTEITAGRQSHQGSTFSWAIKGKTSLSTLHSRHQFKILGSCRANDMYWYFMPLQSIVFSRNQPSEKVRNRANVCTYTPSLCSQQKLLDLVIAMLRFEGFYCLSQILFRKVV